MLDFLDENLVQFVYKEWLEINEKVYILTKLYGNLFFVCSMEAQNKFLNYKWKIWQKLVPLRQRQQNVLLRVKLNINTHTSASEYLTHN